MKAILVEGNRLVWGETERPAIGPGQVRIAVRATAVNRADLVQRQGGYPAPPGASPILGLECAGEVIEVGDSVGRVQAGDHVCALLAGGGYAEEVVVPAGQVLKMPKGLSFVEAASLPEVFATAYLNLYMEGALKTGERVVVHAGASGVGTAAIQLCRNTHNPVFVTVSGQRKIDACVALGAAGGHDRAKGSFVDAVQAWAGAEGVQVILDPVAAPYFADNLKVLSVDGRLLLIGMMGGTTVEANLAVVLMKRIKVIGSTLRARSIAAKSTIMDGLKRDVWPALEAGRIKAIVEAVIPLQEAEKAHALVAANETIGKVVLELKR
jgi:putative PIG3 family NAD(P)H quinone oxidoreductase